MAFIAAATSVVLTVTPAVATVNDLAPPGTPSDLVAVSALPDCAANGIQTTPSVSQNAAAGQLGWVGTARAVVRINATVVEMVPAIPCTRLNAGQVQVVGTVFGNKMGSGNDLGFSSITITVTCYRADGTRVQLTNTGGGNASRNYPNVYVAANENVQSPDFTTTACNRISEVRLTLAWSTAQSSTTIQPLANWVWKPIEWKSATGGWTPATNVNQLLEPGVELPIVCDINTTGEDFFALVGNVVVSLVQWVPCMLIPVGWDRAELIKTEWQNGPTGDLQKAYEAAIPNGIACGVVAVIPMWGNNVQLNTCVADVAPEWGKAALSWILVLGLAVLTVKRIMWAVGSRG